MNKRGLWWRFTCRTRPRAYNITDSANSSSHTQAYHVSGEIFRTVTLEYKNLKIGKERGEKRAIYRYIYNFQSELGKEILA